MTDRLLGKTALVTGAGSGLGAATAIRFAAEGAHVYVTDLDGASAQRVADDIGDRATARRQDVTDEADWDVLMDEILASRESLDILVNCAGIGLTGTAEDTSLADWRKVQEVNLDAVFLGTRAAIRTMKTCGGGSIINISSIEGIIGDPMTAAYNASKGGVRIFTKSAALHCTTQGYNIRVNSVHPGFIMTPLVASALESMGEEAAAAMHERVLASIPMGTMGEPEDIANGCLYLASDEARYVTGSELVIDGGYTCH